MRTIVAWNFFSKELIILFKEAVIVYILILYWNLHKISQRKRQKGNSHNTCYSFLRMVVGDQSHEGSSLTRGRNRSPQVTVG